MPTPDQLRAAHALVKWPPSPSRALSCLLESEIVITRHAGQLPSFDAVGSAFGNGQAKSLDQLRHTPISSRSFINRTHFGLRFSGMRVFRDSLLVALAMHFPGAWG